MTAQYDAFLLVSFGGPEGPDDVLPFLQNVLRGKNVPQERMLEVAEHYYQFGGVSPINEQNRRLLRAVEKEFAAQGTQLPVYWGNRNWHPLLPDTLQKMADDGVHHALALCTSAYSSYSSCRQYLEDIARAQNIVGSQAPQVDKLRAFFNHPGFIEPLIESVKDCFAQLHAEHHNQAVLMFTAHSIPVAMAGTCDYEKQLREACHLVAAGVGHQRWELVYQSRSGPPQQPWLEPDVCDRIVQLHNEDELQNIVILPIGFISDHLEVLFDIDTEARQLCERLGINMLRAATVGTHPRFVRMIRELIVERMEECPERLELGNMGVCPDVCADSCCKLPVRRVESRQEGKTEVEMQSRIATQCTDNNLRRLGKSDLLVSPVAFGSWPIAGVTSLDVNDQDSLETIRACFDVGINFIDTAYCYGRQGESENLIRQALAERREEIVLATKCGIHYNATGEQAQDARPKSIRRECEESLCRLGTDRVELYYLHSPDPKVPIEDSAGAIRDLIVAGKVRYAGASNCHLDQLRAFHTICPLTAVQLPYNMLQREIEQQTIPWCQNEEISVVVYWALMKGLLAGRLSADKPLSAGDGRAKYPMYQGAEWQLNQQFVEQLQQIAQQSDHTVAQLVVNWTIHQSGITVALCGAKRRWQLEETARAMDWSLTANQLGAIDSALVSRGKAAANRQFS